MWTDEQIQKFEQVLDYYRSRKEDGGQEALVALLRETQEIFSCIPATAQEQIAHTMDTKPTVISALIKRFPSLTGEAFVHKITVCTGPRCGANGSLSVLRAMESELGIKAGKVTADGVFLLTTQNCLKKCGTPPNIRIDADDYAHVSPAEIPRILSKYRE